MSTSYDAKNQKVRVGYSPELKRAGFFNFAPLEPQLAEAGKLVLAGPFVDGGERRGVFILKVDSLSEAQALTDTDPAVITVRLKIILQRWAVPKGMLP